MVPLSVLDLVPITQGSTPRIALQHSLDLARHAERLGYRRFWVAEHHNMPGIASAATSVVIAHLAAGRKWGASSRKVTLTPSRYPGLEALLAAAKR